VTHWDAHCRLVDIIQFSLQSFSLRRRQLCLNCVFNLSEPPINLAQTLLDKPCVQSWRKAKNWKNDRQRCNQERYGPLQLNRHRKGQIFRKQRRTILVIIDSDSRYRVLWIVNRRKFPTALKKPRSPVFFLQCLRQELNDCGMQVITN
jgi:hypothetical protein